MEISGLNPIPLSRRRGRSPISLLLIRSCVTMPRTDRPALRLPQIVALYVGAVVGCGILILPGLTADIAGPASVVSWAVMSLLSLPLALTMGFLAREYPGDGGVSGFVRTAFREPAGSLIGWFFLSATVIGVPVLSLTGAGYIAAAFGLSEMVRVIIAAGVLLLGLVLNHVGMRLSGQIQVAVVSTTIVILLGAFLGSWHEVDAAAFFPFAPHGWMSAGYATSLIFWSFIGWEAVTHITGEFEDPARDVVRATVIASGIISILYLLTAFAVIGTGSYGPGLSDVSLLNVIRLSFGPWGAICTGIAALLVCIAPSITYIGAASRLACSLSLTGNAPGFLSRISPRFRTPTGGLVFLCICFTGIISGYCSGLLPLTTLIQLPNAAFILTYLGGCAAGIVLFRERKEIRALCALSLVMTGAILFFVSWAILFPVLITLLWGGYRFMHQR